MFPTFRQRWIIFFSCIIGALIWSQVGFAVSPVDDMSGISIFQSSSGAIVAIFLIIIAGLPAIALGVFAGATGNVLSGLFVVAISLCTLAGSGGGAQGFMLRSTLPGEYVWLIVETVIWLIGLLAVIYILGKLCPKVENHVPEILKSEHCQHNIKITKLNSSAVIGCIVSCLIGGLLTNLLIQTDGAGQSIGGLVIAFFIAAIVSKTFVTKSDTLLILISPAIVAIVSYAYMLLRYTNTHQILTAYYSHQLPGAALVLPIFYISAGTIGAVVGCGLAQVMEKINEQTKEEKGAIGE